MDAKEFLAGKAPCFPRPAEWIFAGAKTMIGIILTWFAALNLFQFPAVVNAWLGMSGIILFLHFGGFHLLALFWQSKGIPAKPLMCAPLLATSLAKFWGERWNTAFHLLAQDLVFRPLARVAGLSWAMLGVFFVSGLIHELVISLPAGGGYGLPTAYFVLQGLAVLFERSRAGRALRLGHGIPGWIFMFVITAGPAFWLFHPIFVHNVILPMLQSIGAN
jgi:alginate O-acetyltransferase complex protein AlgI